MAINCAPGLNFNQQREMLEHCETRKDRFAIVDGPLVSTGDVDIPASQKGFGAMYVPWLKVTKPSWFVGPAPDVSVRGIIRRKLIPPRRTRCTSRRADTSRASSRASTGSAASTRLLPTRS